MGLSRDIIAKIAQTEYFRALDERKIRIPDSVKNGLMLGIEVQGERVIFTIYEPKERPQDAVLFATVIVDRNTGECSVTVEPAALEYESK